MAIKKDKAVENLRRRAKEDLKRQFEGIVGPESGKKRSSGKSFSKRGFGRGPYGKK